MPIYRNSREHLFAELQRLDLILNQQVVRLRSDPDHLGFDQFRGLFIAEEEIDQVLAESRQSAPADQQNEARLNALAEAIERAEQTITQNVADSFQHGAMLSLPKLAGLFQLSPFDVDALLICLAPELDVKYEKLYAYLQNDVTRKRPTPDLILKICCRSLDECLQARTRLLSDAPLIKDELLLAVGEAALEQATLLSRPLRIDERILNYLLGAESVDEVIASCAQVVEPGAQLAEVILPGEIKSELVD